MFERFTRERARGGRAGPGRGRAIGRERDRHGRDAARRAPAAAARRPRARRARRERGGAARQAAAGGSTARRSRRSASTSTRSAGEPRQLRSRGARAGRRGPDGHIPLTPQAKKSLELAVREADRHRRPRDPGRARPARCAARGRCDRAPAGGGHGPGGAARVRSARRRVVADAEGDLLVGPGGERLLARAIGVGLGRQRAARAQTGEHRPEPRSGSGQRPPEQGLLGPDGDHGDERERGWRNPARRRRARGRRRRRRRARSPPRAPRAPRRSGSRKSGEPPNRLRSCSAPAASAASGIPGSRCRRR